MIPSPQRSFPRQAPAPLPVAGWLRRAVADAQAAGGTEAVDIALAAGAAFAALDALVRAQESWAGVWRQRLALAAAAQTARQAGRTEDEAQLRDAVLLTKAGDDPGPAGRLVLAWRRLATWPAAELLTQKSLAAVLDDFGHAADEVAVGDLADELRQLGAGDGLSGMMAGAVAAAARHGGGARLGAFIADALLAQRLGWAHALPLLGSGAAAGQARNLLGTQALAALAAIDLSADLGRRAQRLLAAAPKLRAKGAGTVVEMLLRGDAMVASQPVAGMSERALRRLFDRLVSLDAARELSGRPAFRIYGL